MAKAANSFTRRRFLEATLVGSIPVVLSEFGNLPVVNTTQGTCSSQLPGRDHIRLSNTVLNHVGTELAPVFQSAQSRGSVRAQEVRAVASNVELLFGHFQEAGLNSALEQQTRACQQELLDFVPQEEHIRAIQNQLASFGVGIGRERLREGLSVPHDKRLSAISQIEARGIHGSANLTVAALRRAAKWLEKQESNSIGAPVGLGDEMEDDDQSIRQEICRALAQAEAFFWVAAGICAIVGAVAAAAYMAFLAALIAVMESIIC